MTENDNQAQNAVYYTTAISPDEVSKMLEEVETGTIRFICYLIQDFVGKGRVEYSQHLKLTHAKAREILEHYGAMPRFMNNQEV